MRIEQFHVKNQFLIIIDEGVYFKSYDTIIAFIDNKGKITLDEDKWDYSVTTSKYRNKFTGLTTQETKKKIESGEIRLRDLNA